MISSDAIHYKRNHYEWPKQMGYQVNTDFEQHYYSFLKWNIVNRCDMTLMLSEPHAN